MPREIPKRTRQYPQADSLRFEESYTYSKLGLEDSQPRPHCTGLSHYLFMGLSFLELLDLPSPAPTTISSTFVQTPFTAQHNVCVSLYEEKNLDTGEFGFPQPMIILCGRGYFYFVQRYLSRW